MFPKDQNVFGPLLSSIWNQWDIESVNEKGFLLMLLQCKPNLENFHLAIVEKDAAHAGALLMQVKLAGNTSITINSKAALMLPTSQHYPQRLNVWTTAKS